MVSNIVGWKNDLSNGNWRTRVDVWIQAMWRRQQEITPLPIQRIIMVISNINIRDVEVKWVKSTGDYTSPGEGKHIWQLSLERHPATVCKINRKNNGLKDLDSLGRNPCPVRLEKSDRCHLTIIQFMFVTIKNK